MSTNEGWIKIDRAILAHPLVGAGQPVPPADPSRGSYSRLEAWLWLICNASFRDHEIYNRGRKMTLLRGDLLGSWMFLAHTFNWSKKTVRTWIERLIADEMIRRRTIELQIEHRGVQSEPGTQGSKQDTDKTGNQAQVLSIVNYSVFQDVNGKAGARKGQVERARNRASDGHATGTQRAPQKEGKEGKNNPLSPPEGGDDVGLIFEKWWSVYPARPDRKKRKLDCLQTFEQIVSGIQPEASDRRKVARLPKTPAAALLAAAQRYAASNPEVDFVPAPIVWLNQGRWLDDVPAGNAPQAIPPPTPWWRKPDAVKALSRDRWVEGIRSHANGKWPVDKLGPAPGHPKCVVPRDIISEMRLDEIYTPQGFKRT